jgi:hypothetical protein
MADKQDSKDELVVVGPGADEDPVQPTFDADVRAGEDYQYPDADPDVGDAGEERSDRVGQADIDSDDGEGLSREQRRRRRKKENHDRLAREVDFLRHRNEQLERQRSQELARIESRQTQNDVMAIDGRIAQAQSDVREAEDLLTQALKGGDPGAAVEALRVRDDFRDGLRNLQAAKNQTIRAGQDRQATANQSPAMDPTVAQRAREWAREHSWFDPNGRSEASVIAAVVERQVAAEGRLYGGSDDYWDEVDRRLAKRLPEHYPNSRQGSRDEEDEGASRSQQRPLNGTRKPSGPSIKVGGRERPLKKGEVYIDEDRKAAMIEKGVWDDPVLRERQLQYYQKYDREAGRRPR